MAETSALYSDAAQQVLLRAHHESRCTGHHYVGPEHLLVGLLLAGEGPVQETAQRLGISVDATRLLVKQLVGVGTGLVPSHIPYTHKLQRILSFGYGLARQMGCERAAPEHLMLGLTQEGDAVVARVLQQMGSGLRQVQTELMPRMSMIVTEKSIATRLYESLYTWLEPYNLGRVWRPVQEIRVMTGDLILGDVLFCLDPRQSEQALPDMVVLVCSEIRTADRVRAKLQFLLTVGVRVGVLLDPETHRAEVLRSGQDPELFGDQDRLILTDLLPGWELPLDSLWPSSPLTRPRLEERPGEKLESGRIQPEEN